MNQETERTVADWTHDELAARSGALINEALQNWSWQVKKAHWEDMTQAAMLAFWEHQEHSVAYVYAIVRTVLKKYKWVHIRGLQGGWRSLEAQEYVVTDLCMWECEERLIQQIVGGDVKEDWLDLVPRPVEWRVVMREREWITTEEVFKELMILFAGLSERNWRPGPIYQAARIGSMLATGYRWEDIEAELSLEPGGGYEAWRKFRTTKLIPFSQLCPLQREMVRLLGKVRLCSFEELTDELLNRPQRKMVMLPSGIYTITYSQRTRPTGKKFTIGVMRKSRMVNGKSIQRGVRLGSLGRIQKEELLEKAAKLERKFEALPVAA